jgi:hypothetical protein
VLEEKALFFCAVPSLLPFLASSPRVDLFPIQSSSFVMIRFLI